ncbi:uncharacterized protein LOC23687543 isoform X1 [Aedes aegypti]|uniref:Uncharacterized protein n=1 Tax=Aedes aegypti TaxID=7159 RepID=A0A1S4G5S4_AEDAE|nr:odorant receptor 113 [Aedes aegypti]
MFAEIRGGWYRLKYCCSNEGPAGDCFWLLDVFMLLAGVRSKTTSRWTAERFIRYFINGLFAFQSVIAVLHVLFAFLNKNSELFEVVFHIMKLSGIFVAGAKASLVVYYETPIANVRSLIIGNRINSGDEAYDRLERMKFNRSGRKMMRVVYGVIFVDALLLLIPCAATKKLLDLPPPFSRAGPFTSSILYVLSAQLLFVGVIPKFFCNMACIGTLIIGMRTRLKVLAHRWDRILNYPMECPEFYFERMDREVRIVLDQQMEYWRQLESLKRLVEKSFFIVHYYSLYSIGTCFFVARDLGVNVLAVAIYASAFTYLTKHYLWCHLVDSLQDVADTIGDEIYGHSAQIPYSRKYHQQYVQMKSSLIIVWHNTINGVSMKCMEMIEITTVTFVEMINIVYSVLTFLINMV